VCTCDLTQQHNLCMWYQSSIILQIYQLSIPQTDNHKAHSLSFQTPTLSLGRATSLHETNRHRLLTRLMMRCAIQQQQHANQDIPLSQLQAYITIIQPYELISQHCTTNIIYFISTIITQHQNIYKPNTSFSESAINQISRIFNKSTI
jgi:hypothetical protein